MTNVKKVPTEAVKQPFLTGDPVDASTPKSSLMVFGGLLITAFAYMMGGAVMTFDNLPLRLLLNGLMLIVVLSVFFYAGASNGTSAVNQGEILYRRKETSREIKKEEQALCYHRFKGFLIGFFAAIPLFICACILAATTQRLMTTPGALPSWLTGLTSRKDITDALHVYTAGSPVTLTVIVRVIVRLALMPFVNMISASNPDGLLLLERLSPLLVLLPGAAYGFGYTRGPSNRSRVHTDIARNKKTAAKKARLQKKRRAAAQRSSRGPQQLN